MDQWRKECHAKEWKLELDGRQHMYIKKKVEEEEQDRDYVYSYMLYMYKNNKKKPSQIQMTKSIQVRRVQVK